MSNEIKARTLSVTSCTFTLAKAWDMLTPSQQKVMRELSWHWEGKAEPLVRLKGGMVAFEASGRTWTVGKRGKVQSWVIGK